jgi:hypothetical protein
MFKVSVKKYIYFDNEKALYWTWTYSAFDFIIRQGRRPYFKLTWETFIQDWEMKV